MTLALSSDAAGLICHFFAFGSFFTVFGSAFGGDFGVVVLVPWDLPFVIVVSPNTGQKVESEGDMPSAGSCQGGTGGGN